MSVLTDLRHSPMSRYQKLAISIALLIVLIDGYDLAVMSFAAPALSLHWGISDVQLGFLLSASLFGMAAGSILLTPLADRIGRRPLTMIAVAIISIGMIGSVLSPDEGWLFAARVITGFGIGGIAANLNVLVIELSSDKHHGLAMGLYGTGFPIGATICGFLARPLIPQFGWQSVFAVGAVITVLMLVVAYRHLPESLEFLLTKRPPGALEKINATLRRMDRPPLDALPPVEHREADSGGIREIFTGVQAYRTILLWIGYGALAAGYYFANTWTPKIMATATGDPSLGVTIGTIVNFGGIIGSVAFGLLTIYIGVRSLLIGILVAAGVSFLVFGLVMGQLGIALFVAAALGVLISAALLGFYTVSPRVYSTRTRATGTGWMIGIGRLIAIVSPIVVGYLFAARWSPDSVFFLYAIPLFASATCIGALAISMRTRALASAASRPTSA